MRILFIGNSLTYYNQSVNSDFAKLLLHSEFTESDNQDNTFDECTQGGATLRNLWRQTKAKDLIQQNNYDYVVLQEDLPETTITKFHDYGARFIRWIRQHKSIPILFMTWAYDRLPGTTNRMIQHAHIELAQRCQCDIAPVSIARLESASLSKMLVPTMFDPDQEHPSSEATYLAALVIYITVTKSRTFTHKTYAPNDMEPTLAITLQQIATSVCSSHWCFEDSSTTSPTTSSTIASTIASTVSSTIASTIASTILLEKSFQDICKKESNTCEHKSSSTNVTKEGTPSSPTFHKSFSSEFSKLPADLIKSIALFSTAEDLTNFCLVCKDLSSVVLNPLHDNELWETLYRSDFPKQWAFEQKIIQMKVGIGRRSNSNSGRLRRFRLAYLTQQEQTALHEMSLSMCGC